MIIINHDGDTWRIVGQGSARDGKTFCHLASTTRGRWQRNGWVPVQIGDWIDNDAILSAAIEQEELHRKAANQSHAGACVPWRGRDGALGSCIYCGKKPDAITAYYLDRAASGQAALTAHRP